MESFPGLAHRMELLGRRGRVLFVNDSKATNADAAAKALATFEPVYWIAGGQAKEGGIAPLVAAAEICHAIHHGRRRVHVAVRDDFPGQRAGRGVQRVEMIVVGPHQHEAVGHDRRRLDLRNRLVRPLARARGRVHGMQDALGDRRRRRRRWRRPGMTTPMPRSGFVAWYLHRGLPVAASSAMRSPLSVPKYGDAAGNRRRGLDSRCRPRRSIAVAAWLEEEKPPSL